MTHAELEGLMKGIAPAIREYVQPLKQRIEALEARPQPKGFSYCGVFEPGQTYEANDSVTHADSLWIARSQTAATPGGPDEDARAWRMALRKPRDRDCHHKRHK